MAQKIIFSGIVSLFLMIWGLVIYQIFIEEKPLPLLKYAHDSRLMQIQENKEIVDIETEFFLTTNRNGDIESKVIVQTRTEKNKLSQPPLQDGIDFGEGVSIDDLLESLEIVMNTN